MSRGGRSIFPLSKCPPRGLTSGGLEISWRKTGHAAGNGHPGPVLGHPGYHLAPLLRGAGPGGGPAKRGAGGICPGDAGAAPDRPHQDLGGCRGTDHRHMECVARLLCVFPGSGPVKKQGRYFVSGISELPGFSAEKPGSDCFTEYRRRSCCPNHREDQGGAL